jgi:hypothetical protein
MEVLWGNFRFAIEFEFIKSIALLTYKEQIEALGTWRYIKVG